MSDAEEKAAKITSKIHAAMAIMLILLTHLIKYIAYMVCSLIIVAVLLTSIGVLYQLGMGTEVAGQLILTPLP